MIELPFDKHDVSDLTFDLGGLVIHFKWTWDRASNICNIHTERELEIKCFHTGMERLLESMEKVVGLQS